MEKYQKTLVGIGLMLAVGGSAKAALTVDVSRMTLEVAKTIAINTLKSCREKGLSVSVTVVDRNGIVQAQLRDTLAPPVSLGISRQKAYTAVMFNLKGSLLIDRAKSPLQMLGADLAFMAGSVPISAGGKLYGAVGVSGAPDGMDDEACATVGVESVLENLEMQ